MALFCGKNLQAGMGIRPSKDGFVTIPLRSRSIMRKALAVTRSIVVTTPLQHGRNMVPLNRQNRDDHPPATRRRVARKSRAWAESLDRMEARVMMSADLASLIPAASAIAPS